MENEIIEHESSEVVITDQPPLSQYDKLLEISIQKGADLSQIEKLIDLKIKYDNEQARKAYTAAMAQFKSKCVVIKKDRRVSFEINDGKDEMSYFHASIGNIVNSSAPALAECGLSARWDIQQKEARIYVTCIMSHRDGHSESVTLDGSPDTGGKKNSIQQVSSTITYLQRYSYLAITGLAVEEQDDDGKGAGPVIEYITEEEQKTIKSMIEDNDLNLDLFKKWAKVEDFNQIKSDKFSQVVSKINISIKNAKEKANNENS